MLQTYSFDNRTTVLRILHQDGLKHYCRDNHISLAGFDQLIALSDDLGDPKMVIASCKSLNPMNINPTHRILVEVSHGETSAKFLALRSSLERTLAATKGKINLTALNALELYAIKISELDYASLQSIPGTEYLYIDIEAARVFHRSPGGKRAFLEYSTLPNWEELRAHLPGSYVPSTAAENSFFTT